MGITISKNKIRYLNYFLSLEKNLETIFKYIEPDKNNLKTYSLENAKLYLLIGSEIDILLKEILGGSNDNMNKYRNSIISRSDYGTKFYNQKVAIEKYGIKAKAPWINFKSSKNPDWWKSYNEIKHDRFNHFSEANLKNLVNALCGLFIVVSYYISDDINDLGVYHDSFGGNHINDETILCKLI